MQSINVTQAGHVIKTIGATNTVCLEGPPGIGKTSMAVQLAKELGLQAVVVDCATLTDGGDIKIPRFTDRGEYKDTPNAAFRTADGTPVLVVLDELGKANRAVMNSLAALIHERRIGEYPLGEGSIVCATSNNSADGVGDNVPAHVRDRMTLIQVRNATSEEWVKRALTQGIAGELIAFATMFPQIFDHYSTVGKYSENPYIFDPRDAARRKYTTPRSLYQASNIVHQRAQFDHDVLVAMLAGTIGHAAAADMTTMLALGDKMEDYATIVRSPTKCRVPDRGPAQIIAAVTLLARAGDKPVAEREAVATYLGRLEPEVQVLAVHMAHNGPHMARWVINVKAMTQLAINASNLV